jgi:NADPH:quinone reductase-like Zn-dependent oxidoreductase
VFHTLYAIPEATEQLPEGPPVSDVMHALRIHARAGPEALVYESAAVPEPGIGDLLVRVGAASFTPTELSWPSTWVDRRNRDRTPVIPGHEVSGTVAALGYGATGHDIGAAVFGLTDWYRDGTAAEYVVVEARNLASKPARLDHVEAAASAMPAMTAMQGLFTHGGLARGQTVLIQGAGGGVGTVAIQLARAADARVLASARSWARDLVLELGAHEFIDADGDSATTADGVDVVFDLVGGDVLGRSWSLVRAGGTVVSVVEDPAARPEAREDARAVFFVVEAKGAMLDELAAQMNAGQLRPVVGAVHPLAEGRAAFVSKKPGKVPGKVVLAVAP